MPKHLILVDDAQARFIIEAMNVWRRIHEGDHSDQAYAGRGTRLDIGRQLEGKYTKAEAEEIGAIALELLE